MVVWSSGGAWRRHLRGWRQGDRRERQSSPCAAKAWWWLLVREQRQLGTCHQPRTISYCLAGKELINDPNLVRPIAWSPDFRIQCTPAHRDRRTTTNSLWSLIVMAGLQSKASIISRTSFAALEVEEPESEEELEVVELPPAE